MDQYSKSEIEKIAWKILKDAGLTMPPIKPNDLIEHLRLNLDFYSLEDPSFVQNLTHKFKIKVNHVKSAIKKSKLVAAWLPDNSKIVIDGTLPKLKQIWPQFHEITHSVLPWHKEFFLGDTAQMLDPEYQEILEEEANYGASELLFCGPQFRSEVKDVATQFKNVHVLSKQFEASVTTTLRKFVTSQEEVCCFAAVSLPPWIEESKNPGILKYIIPSKKFEAQFASAVREAVKSQINPNITFKTGGPVGEFVLFLNDLNGDMYEFECESFFNTYEVLTLAVQRIPKPRSNKIDDDLLG